MSVNVKMLVSSTPSLSQNNMNDAESPLVVVLINMSLKMTILLAYDGHSMCKFFSSTKSRSVLIEGNPELKYNIPLFSIEYKHVFPSIQGFIAVLSGNSAIQQDLS